MYQVTFHSQHEGAFVVAPAALVAGNRFPAIRVPYSPRYPEGLAGPETPTTLTDVPRLEVDPEGASFVEFFSGAMSWPAVGCWCPESGEVLLLEADSHAEGSEVLWRFEEAPGHDCLSITLRAPGARTSRYVHMDNNAAASDPDPGTRDFPIRVVETRGHASSVESFFRILFERWALRLNRQAAPATCPLSFAFDTIEHKYNRENWQSDWKLYLTSESSDGKYPYQTGWCGGGIASYALAASEDGITRERSILNTATACREGATAAGLIYGCRRPEGWSPEFKGQPNHPYTWRWTLTRRQGDALYYLAKDLLRRPATETTDPRPATLRRLADAFCTTLANNPDPARAPWGHFLDNETGEILVGGTTSGAIIPAALLLAHEVEHHPSWLVAAEEGARRYREQATAVGASTGGPGDALGCPDSESAFALMESFVWLWQASGEAEWLDAAADAARQALLWVMPYAWPFPPDTEFGRLEMDSTGTVFANVQNKHSAPGICTHSGEGLLRLFRASGDRRFLDGLRAIVRALPQTMSRADRPITALGGQVLPEGWINERVNTNDWDNNTGGVFHGSCWCEVSLLLTWLELPGIYAQPDSGLIACLDHVEADWVDAEKTQLRIHNPTPFAARVRVQIETSTDAQSRPLPNGFAESLPVIHLAPGETTVHPNNPQNP